MSKLSIEQGAYPCIEEIHGLPFKVSVVLGASDLTVDDGIARSQAMRRVVACWNAFDGVTTEKIEGRDVGAIMADLATEQQLVDMSQNGISIRGYGAQLLASTMAGQFLANGATNFLEMKFEHDELGPFTVTMQRAEGRTPADLRAEAEDKLRVANENIAQLHDGLNTYARAAEAAEAQRDKLVALIKEVIAADEASAAELAQIMPVPPEALEMTNRLRAAVAEVEGQKP